ncbi:MAG TPA: hypothetical protein VFA69_05800 [Candidatus Nitrosotalea sp.]|nr:hypothetical protein [Candidatus Nitrosotalea sp.]
MSELKISVTVIKLPDASPTEQQLDDSKTGPFVDGLITLPFSVLNQEWLTLPISEMEWESLGDNIAKQGGMKEKSPHDHDFRVLKWKYFPQSKKARVYLYNDLAI